MPNQYLDAALKYLDYGFSIFPAYTNKERNKKPYVQWENYQKVKPTKEQVVEWWTEWPNAMIGAVTGKISDLIAFDFDIYKIDYKKAQQILNIIPTTIKCPTSRTPRGGYHKFFRYPTDQKITNFSGKAETGLLGFDIRGEGGFIVLPPSCGLPGERYTWEEGKSLFDIDLLQLNSSLLLNIIKLINTNCNNHANDQDCNYKPLHSITKHYITLETPGRNDSLFHVGNCLKLGGMERENIIKTINWLASNCKPPLDQTEVNSIIQSVFKREKKREAGLADAIKEFFSITEHYIPITEVEKALQTITNVTRNNLRVSLHRLSKEGFLKKDPNRDGYYKRVFDELDETDWMNVEVKELPIKYPFGIHQVFITMPKNIIVIAGTSDAGKTAFLLDFVNKNMDKFKGKINYFSSEMGAMELKARIQKFGYDLDLWKDKFKFFERGGQFADVIKPNEINIIDFLDVTDEFWKVGGLIKDIFDKLEDGICLIALQKNPDKVYGRGGALSIEKARLYLTIDPGKVKIVKAKNWRTEVNPNGLFKTFKLVGGAKFVSESSWDKDDSENNKSYKNYRQPGEEG